MDVRVGIGVGNPKWVHTSWSTPRNQRTAFKPCCSSRSNSQQPPRQDDGGDDLNKNNKGDALSTDWDKAWSRFKSQGKKSLFSGFNPNKYVSWNPGPSDYPLSEEVDPIKRTERSNLMLWTSPRFTLILSAVIVSLLIAYTLLIPTK